MKDEKNYLLHIRDAIERILLYTGDGREVFLGDIKTQDAVIRNLEIIGEAVKHLSDATTQRRLDIPWKEIAGMRDVLIHHYFGVKLDAVWEVVKQHLGPLAEAVEYLLTPSASDNS